MDEFKAIVASNIIRLRQAKGYTQADLAEQISYSDKTISKWERAEALPDVYVLKQLADIFGVSVEYMISSHDEWDNPEKEKQKEKMSPLHALLTLIILAGIFTATFLVFTICWILGKLLWKLFVYALPVSLITWLVLNSVWNKGRNNSVLVFFLVLTIIAVVYVSLLKYNPWQLFIVAIPAELIVVLSFMTERTLKK